MTLETLIKIRNNINYQNYLRQNSNWYKYLNRDPSNFKNFESAVKEQLRFRKVDKINNTLKTLEMLESLMNSMK